ncbi:sodium:calcium antiporter [Amycolatopsis sp. FDAARGOS 1241]|uniref:sodium:calcium antiporter n=1 Tax=Amycolatopsis sp. FDAARGOS 1241 TaxID=2778070 RepID=UPI00194F1447|nr:sodium:proton exchanger [Amycolatopsis sp. FDAARGOS 1241]QRP50286.1 sodium:proton exchanger [Amycolatopsis sp. FDAARGOS 1241]
MSILIFIAGAALLIYSAEKLIIYVVGAAAGLRISVFLLAIIFTGIEFDDVALGVALNIEDLSDVALGTVFGTAISMIGIVLALAAIISPTKVNIPRPYLALFVAAPVVLVPFIVFGPLTPVYGAVLVLLFVLFIGYVASRELKRTTPVFRNAEILEKLEVGASPGGSGTGTGHAVTRDPAEVPTDKPPFVVTVPFTKERPIPGWAAIALAVLALAGLVAGAAITSYGTQGILQDYQIQGALFGATIATLVLTLEDVFLTVEPTRKGAPELGVGNVIGSVVFGVTAKLGIILLAGGSIVVGDHVLSWHLPVLVGMTALAAYFLGTRRLRRWHGFVLLALYIAYWTVSFAVFGGAPIETD